MKVHLSNLVRNVAKAAFVQPAVRAGKRDFSIPVKELMKNLQAQGFPPNHTPQICSAVQTAKFLTENGLEIVGIDGPASKTSTTVVFHYRVKDNPPSPSSAHSSELAIPAADESPRARAKRLTEELRGLLKNEIAAYGGTEGFIRWVRGYDEDAE